MEELNHRLTLYLSNGRSSAATMPSYIGRASVIGVSAYALAGRLPRLALL